MSYIREKFTYLQGLAKGLDLGNETKEEKMIHGIMELLEEMTYVLDDMDSELEEIDEFMEFIDDDLSALEDEVYEGFLDDEDYSDYEFDFDDDYDYDEAFDNELFCPECGAFVVIDEDLDEVQCPDCGSEFDIEYVDEEDDEDDDEEEEELDV